MTNLEAALVQRGCFFLLALLGTLLGTATAQPLEDVTLRYGEKGIVATIAMTSPIQYLRHYPAKRGRTLEIFYVRAPGATADEKWVNNEVRKSPPSSLIPGFTVTTRNQNSKPKLVIKFKRTANYTVTPGKDGRSLLVTIRPYKQSQAKTKLRKLPLIGYEKKFAADANPVLVKIAKQARVLMIEGRDALRSKDNAAAVTAFNQLLLLPPNDYSRSGQEWVGVARERVGQVNKAKIEYELYLTLYPTGKGTSVVRQRLGRISGKSSEKIAMGAEDSKKQTARMTTYGGISSRYYWGSSDVDSSFIFNNVQTSDSFSLVEQSALITNIDATARYITDDYDNRLVFRDVLIQDFINDPASRNRIHSLYAEVKNRKLDYSLRVGRQSPKQGGVVGRFDGVAGEYKFTGGFGFMEGLRIKASTGVLTSDTSDIQPSFKAASWEMGMFSGYFVSQKLDGFIDRRAVGGEFRYYKKGMTAYTLVEYDIYFDELNTILFSGSMDIGGGTTVSLLMDHRRAPTLSMRNALFGSTADSIESLRQSLTAEELRALAKQRTATSNFLQVGAIQKLTEKWQVGGDLKLTSITGLSASGAANTPQGLSPAIESIGTEGTATATVIGNNLLQRNDVFSSNINVFGGGKRDAYSLSLFYQFHLSDQWLLNASLVRYIQKDAINGELTRNSPLLRTSYRFTDRFSADADFGMDLTESSGTLSSNTTARQFFSAGVRWDF
ncbi:MAG: tetratricopeptide repeat protein [Gallionella sp.]